MTGLLFYGCPIHLGAAYLATVFPVAMMSCGAVETTCAKCGRANPRPRSMNPNVHRRCGGQIVETGDVCDHTLVRMG